MNEYLKQALDEAHIKWLEKAETVKINGTELTVLPYGYLQAAIKEALLDYQARVREIVRGLEKKRTADRQLYKFNGEIKQIKYFESDSDPAYNRALADIFSDPLLTPPNKS